MSKNKNNKEKRPTKSEINSWLVILLGLFSIEVNYIIISNLYIFDA